MSLLSMSCAIALQFADPCATSAAPDPQPMTPVAGSTAGAMSEDELAAVHGMGLPAVGLDDIAAASRARSVALAFDMERPSDQVREVTDNWNVQVAAPLIAQAISDARR